MILPTPHRQDRGWFAGLLFENQAWKFTTLLLGAGFLAMGALVYWDVRRPKEIFVVDSSTGRTYTTGRLTNNHIENMLLYATKTFTNDFLNYDHLYIEQGRLAAFKRMSPALQIKFKENLSAEGAIKDAISNRTKFELDFVTEPSVIFRSHPEYRTFTKVRRIITFPDGKATSTEFNLRISWTMRESTADRPDGLYVTDIELIDPNDKKSLDAILNQIH